LFGFGKPKNKRKTKISIKNQVPSKVPPLYDGNRLIVYKKIDKNLEIDEEITIKAKTTEGILEHTFKVLNDSFIEGRNLHQLFARKLIEEVEERQETENNEEGKELIIELGVKYHLASKHTSFVGVDEKFNSFAAGIKTRKVANQTPFGNTMFVPMMSVCAALLVSRFKVSGSRRNLPPMSVPMPMSETGVAAGIYKRPRSAEEDWVDVASRIACIDEEPAKKFVSKEEKCVGFEKRNNFKPQ